MASDEGEFKEEIGARGRVPLFPSPLDTAQASQAPPDGILRYRFPKSPSKRFRDALEFAQGLHGYREDGSDYWVEVPPGGQPSREFRELERISQGWKGAGHFIGDTRVTHHTWWTAANPFGKFAKANVADNWIERKLWLDWGKPENLVVGESYRQGNLRGLSGVDSSVLTLHPFAVTLEREPGNSHDRNAIKAIAGGVHVGYLAGERAAVVGPAMDQAGIKEMKVAGVLSGSTDLGMHIWPDRLLTDGIMVGDPSRPVPTTFVERPRPVYEDYLEEKRNFRPANAAVRTFTAPQETPNADAALDGCLKLFAWIVIGSVAAAGFVILLLVGLSV